MVNLDFEVFDLEKHDTKDIKDNHINGFLTVIWRDWDKTLQKNPNMVYVTSAFPNEIKGPHLHKERSSYFICIEGKVVFVIKDSRGIFHDVEVDSEHPKMIHVPKMIPSAHINIAKKNSKILTLTDISWKPNNTEMDNVTFDDYNWSKWIKDY